jgi:hypothetical protein
MRPGSAIKPSRQPDYTIVPTNDGWVGCRIWWDEEIIAFDYEKREMVHSKFRTASSDGEDRTFAEFITYCIQADTHGYAVPLKEILAERILLGLSIGEIK